MSTIFDEVMYYTTRLKTQVMYKAGEGRKEKRDLFASGVWIASKRGGKHLFFVTNRHLTDYEYDEKGWKHSGVTSILNLDIELRKFNGNTPLSETAFFDIVSVQNKIYYPSDGSDLAIIAISTQLNKFKEATSKGYRPFCLFLDNFLAEDRYFKNKLKAIDGVSFVGFPKGAYDKANNLPIARNANIASVPERKFKNDWIEGDLTLVSGLSFGGSSGSPVYSLPVGNPAVGAGRVLESKLIGIMSGHLVDQNNQHKGLSYFVKSTKILETLTENNLLS